MIKTIIFDWGSVIAPPDNKIASKILKQKFNIDANKFLDLTNKYEAKYCITKTDREYFQILSKELKIPQKEIKAALTEAKPTSVFNLAEKLSKNYNIYLLSDQTRFKGEYIKKNYDLSFMKDYYFSYEYESIKTSVKAFKYFIKKSKENPKECLFIDDNPKNIETAKKIGIKGIIFTTKKDLISKLKKI